MRSVFQQVFVQYREMDVAWGMSVEEMSESMSDMAIISKAARNGRR